MPVSWIEHKGKKILYFDNRGFDSPDTFLPNLETLKEEVIAADGGILILSDFRDTTVPTAFMTRVKKYGKEIFNAKFAKHAIIGITGLKKALATAYITFSGDKMVLYPSEEEAKDYLVG